MYPIVTWSGWESGVGVQSMCRWVRWVRCACSNRCMWDSGTSPFVTSPSPFLLSFLLRFMQLISLVSTDPQLGVVHDRY